MVPCGAWRYDWQSPFSPSDVVYSFRNVVAALFPCPDRSQFRNANGSREFVLSPTLAMIVRHDLCLSARITTFGEWSDIRLSVSSFGSTSLQSKLR